MFAGIDIGSVTSKAVIMDEEEILSFSILDTAYNRYESGRDVLNLGLEKIGKAIDAIIYIVSTGYGRRSFTPSNKILPEIVCHARGTKFLFPGVRTIIDIGGQDSKIIELDEDGCVNKFEMNDKCAAGTGRFLEVLSERILGLRLEELDSLSSKCESPCVLSSMCTVFAESEIISYLSENKAKEDIICGMNNAIAKRVINMGISALIDYRELIVFSGGVAKSVGVVNAIQEELGKKIVTPKEPQITAALGAALFAADSVK